MQQQQQQPGSYNLLAVFPDETKAEAAASKLRKEGFSDDEVFHLPSSAVGNGEFREHGPNMARRDVFLQVQRSRPNPLLILVFAVIFGVVMGALATGAGDIFKLPEPSTIIVGVVIGIVIGIVFGVLRRGRVRGAIGQDLSKVNATASRAEQGALTVVALRLADPENISRMSRARAMLINNGGKIDRSVGRRE
ncbi:MAG: hypothetical protein JO011_18580 [Ktedonobacteraceae bacterium]|nr:hypothetical protein [Ktedonobacteraceae bacterium]